MEKEIKLSNSSAKSKLNGMEEQMSALSMMGTGTGTGFGGFGTGTGSESGPVDKEGTESCNVSFSFENINWNGSVTASYKAQVSENPITHEYDTSFEYCNYSFSFRGSRHEEESGSLITVIEGLSVAGSLSSSVLADVEFVILETTYKWGSDGEQQVVSSNRKSTSARLSAELVPNEFGDFKLHVSFN